MYRLERLTNGTAYLHQVGAYFTIENGYYVTIFYLKKSLKKPQKP